MPLVRCGAALPTPATPGGGVDWGRFIAHATAMLAAGCDTLVPFGTTGEGASIPAAVRSEVYARFANAGIPAEALVPCLYGAAAEAGAAMAEASKAGAKGVLLVPPYYFNDASEDGLFAWVSEVFETAGARTLPTLLYHIPGVTGTPIPVPLVARLRLAFPDLVAGVKDSSGDQSYCAALLAEHRDLTILVGAEPLLAGAVRQGASGAISGCMNVAPALVSRLARGEDDARIVPLVDWVLSGPVVPNIKALMAVRTGDPAWAQPFAPLTRSAADVPAAIADLLG
ncbi:MAG: dihydrodipicolinate synthase family protein [Pseudomonadota bacterium]